jgi:serine/threonine protein kinase
MPVIVNLEGSEEDFAKLLILHQIISPDQLAKALENRQSQSAKAAALEPLRDTLLRLGYVSSSLIFEVLRVASKVVEECTKCGAIHHIYFYHPHSRFFCAYCKGPLKVTDPGQALKWTPGQLASAAAKASAAGGPPPSATQVIRRANPLDDPSLASLPAADETMLDMGSTPKAKPAAPKPAPAATPAPPPAAARPAPRPAALPPQTPKAPIDPTVTILPVYGDETMLDMGSTPKSKSMKPAAPPAAPAPEAKPASTKPAPLPDETVRPLSLADETMLDMGSTPRSKTAPPAAAAPTPTAPAPKPPAPVDQSIVPSAMGEETMLDMGMTPRSKSTPSSSAQAPEAKPIPPAPVDQSIVPSAMGEETMLDMGARPTGRPVLLPGEKPEFPVIPKAPAQSVADFTTSVIPGKNDKTGISTTQDATGAGNPEVTRTGPAIDPTLMVTPPSSTVGSTTAGTGTISNVDKTQIQHAVTPKPASGSGMGASAAMANAKAMPAEVAAAAKDPNRIFGKYILLNELGRGGAGVVYKAWDTILLQHVALKFIRNQDDSDADSTSGSSQIEEFQREARMSVRLRHPNIVRIYEMGCMSNRYYLSMEYIEGGTLLAMIHGGKERNQKTRFLSNPEQFLKIMINISLAVDYAHHEKQPVVHRDLKPHNVLVDKSSNPYVVDFGLAKEVESGDGATLTGVVKGTPTYMAPEQAEGRNRDVDLRTDVYALGAILYEMLTGRPPFLGESVPEILRKIATELPERPNDVITKAVAAEAAASSATATATSSKAGKSKTKALLVPKTLETICLKALEKNKNDRYQTAKEFAEDIDRYMKGEDILATEPNLWRRFRRTVRRHPVISAAAAAILLASTTGLIAMRAARGTGGEDRAVLIQRKVTAGEDALASKNWAALRVVADDLANLDANHPKVSAFRKAVTEHEELLARTGREWNADLDRIRREPLSKVLPALREKYHRLPELQEGFRASLKGELVALQQRVLGESNRLVGTGARPAWVEEIIKQNARDCKEQFATLLSLENDKDFPYPKQADVVTAVEGLTRVIDYQGTWSLQVNVAPYAQITVLRADKELASDFTPLGLQELEVVGSSYVVELNWPSRENPKVKMKEEIKDLHHGQTVVILGDLTKESLKLERR